MVRAVRALGRHGRAMRTDGRQHPYNVFGSKAEYERLRSQQILPNRFHPQDAKK